MITSVGAAFWYGFALGDLVVYIPLLVLGLVGHWRRRAWSRVVLGGALGITVYWPVVCLAAVVAARGAPGWELEGESAYWMVLPAIAMGWYQVAALMRLTRSAMLEVLDSEYIKLARIKGVPEWRVIWVHALRNAAIVPLTYFGVISGIILTGSVVVETVFAWPGTGLLAIEAIRGRDFPVVQAVVLTFAGVFIVANLAVDVLYAYLDPRIRYQ